MYTVIVLSHCSHTMIIMPEPPKGALQKVIYNILLILPNYYYHYYYYYYLIYLTTTTTTTTTTTNIDYYPGAAQRCSP